MTSREIRQRFLDFFEKRQHVIIDSVSLVTSDEKGVTDPTLFNTAGMQHLIPYFMGLDHPEGKRLVNSQKCLRTIDIEEVGDKTHLTFFEMLGNWSIGDYFKKDAIKWSYEFLTSKGEGLGLDPEKIYITVFAGNEIAPRDKESAEIWQEIGIPKERIYYLEDNWWEAGDSGPGGIDTEIFYNITDENLGNMTHEEFVQSNDEQKVIEIWNNVFMEYEKRGGQIVGKLPRHIVDTGAGLERVLVTVNSVKSIYDTDLFEEVIEQLKENSKDYSEYSARIIADHIRSSVMLISDGVLPSNTDRGYILRRLIRRAVSHADRIGLKEYYISELVPIFIKLFSKVYSISEDIDFVLEGEEKKFRKTLTSGLKEFEKISDRDISGSDAFKLFSTYGFPVELTEELAKERGISVNLEGYQKEFEKHQEKSRTAAEGKFKGGLSDTGKMEIKYHTATHLLNAALRKILGNSVEQKGSNISSERLRFDFSYSEKLTNEQKEQIEEFVNRSIEAGLDVVSEEMELTKAKESGATGIFNDKYGDTVTVYTIENVSKEICGGPHVANTSELGRFRIKKEEASSTGVRRIRAVLE